MKCKYCDGTGTSNICVNGTFKPCSFCDGTGEFDPNEVDRFNAVDFIKVMEMVKKPLTNEEWIKSCTTEQLADALMKIFAARTFCHLCPEGDVCDIGYKCKYSDGKKIEDWLAWLKEKHYE